MYFTDENRKNARTYIYEVEPDRFLNDGSNDAKLHTLGRYLPALSKVIIQNARAFVTFSFLSLF